LGLDYDALYTEVYGDAEEDIGWSEYLEPARDFIIDPALPSEKCPQFVLTPGIVGLAIWVFEFPAKPTFLGRKALAINFHIHSLLGISRYYRHF